MLGTQLPVRRLVAALIFLTASGRLGAQPALRPGPSSDSPQPKQFAGAPQPTKAARTDLYGDPLPAGAIARLGTVRLRHGAYVSTVAFSPDGKQLLTHGNNGVCIWDVVIGKEIRSLRDTWMGSAAVSADGKFVMSTENPL